MIPLQAAVLITITRVALAFLARRESRVRLPRFFLLVLGLLLVVLALLSIPPVPLPIKIKLLHLLHNSILLRIPESQQMRVYILVEVPEPVDGRLLGPVVQVADAEVVLEILLLEVGQVQDCALGLGEDRRDLVLLHVELVDHDDAL